MADSKPSKSAQKKKFLALQALGEELIGLAEEQLRNMNLNENLLDAVTTASKIKSRGALRRQRQLIGKLMRDVDPAPIRRELDAIQRQEKTAKDIFRRAERWRDRIVQREHDGLKEFFDMTGMDNEQLASLVEEYLTATGNPARRALRRKIFQQIHNELTAAVQNCGG